MSKLNTSGYKPYDIGVMVKIKPPADKVTKGGIILNSSIDAVSIEAVQKGILVDKTELAFSGIADAPEIGDEVLFVKYAGQFLYPHMTDDEGSYRIMDSTDIRLIRSKT